MDSTDSESRAPKSVFGSGWMKKKLRYEEEDIALSPPDDSTFFSLRFGHHPIKPSESMYDRINKELGLSLESSKGNVTELNLAPATQLSHGHSAQLMLGTSGVTLEHCKLQNIHPTELPIVTGECANDSSKVAFTEDLKEDQNKKPLLGLPESPEKSFVDQQDVETLVRKARGGRPTRKISMNLADTIDRGFLECVDELKIENTARELQHPNVFCNTLPSSTAPPITTQLIDSIPIVTGVGDRIRKTSAPSSLNPMLMETQKASNYFFTGSLFSTGSISSSQADLSSTKDPPPSAELATRLPSTVSEPCSPVKQLDSVGNAALHLSLSQTTSMMDERTKEAAAHHEPKPKMGKRRPKASALREMNFLAPQSM